MEDSVSLVILLLLEGHDFPLPVYDEAESDALHPAGRKLRLDFPPEDRREFETYEPVQDPAGLLGIHKVHVNVPRCLDCVENRILGDFVEYDSLGVFFL